MDERLEGSVDEDADSRILETLAVCAVSDIVRIDAIPGDFLVEVPERPVVSPLVRAQAASGDFSYVSSLQNRSINVDQAATALLAMLDGSNGRIELAERIKELIADESLVVRQEGEPTDDAEVIAEASEQQAVAFLEGFAANGLLKG